VRIDRRRKLPATTLLYALGLDDEEILDTSTKIVTAAKDGWKMPFDRRSLARRQAEFRSDRRQDRRRSSIEAGTKITPRLARKLAENGLKDLLVLPSEDLYGSSGRRHGQ
jgi:DNA-directed RNA polymerase subunit beta